MKRLLPTGFSSSLLAAIKSPGGFLLVALSVVSVSLSLGVLTASADTWRGDLQRGGSLYVDPDTHRAVQDYGGVQRPAWDGVHRLEDGSTVIIRDGIAVPTEEMYQAWGQGGKPEPTFAERYCDQLVRKTCGFDNACSTSAACLRARSLLADEAREQASLPITAGAHPLTATSERCRQALSDPELGACASLEAALGDSRCHALVEQVCGAQGECDGSQPCDAARQLLDMETEERLTNDDPGALSITGRQCIEAMGNPFFKPCASETQR
jgi:hypothetical protein